MPHGMEIYSSLTSLTFSQLVDRNLCTHEVELLDVYLEVLVLDLDQIQSLYLLSHLLDLQYGQEATKAMTNV